MHPTSLSRLSGWSFLLVVIASAVSARAEIASAASVPESVELDRFIISASRTPQDAALTPSSVSLLDLRELEDIQVPDLASALAREPGVVVSHTGAMGGQTSVFLRGAPAHQTLFVVDGIRMNDRSAAYFNFLGGADLTNLGRIEILRGPQSTLYGSSAMGGVILLESARGSGDPSGVLSASYGSFDTFGGALAMAGSSQNVSYSAAVTHRTTANDLPENDFRSWSYAGRLEYAATSQLVVGGTFRAQNDEFEQTGSRFFRAPGVVDSDNYLATVYADLRVRDALSSKLVLGHHRRRYAFTDQWGTSKTENSRNVLDWQNTWQASPQLEIVGGAGYERSRYDVNDARSRDEVGALYVSGTWTPLRKVTVTGGLRYDDFKSVGDATTGRVGASWRPVEGTKLRTTYGTGFTAPGSDDRYGVPQWGQLPNPNLKPEKSRGWDVGIDQDLFGRATASITYFKNKYRNLFTWEYVDLTTYQGRTINAARARTSGVEASIDGEILPWLHGRFGYTYLDAEDLDTDLRLVRRPRHVVDAELRAQPSQPWTFGVGVRAVVDRVEQSGPVEDYTTVRVFASYQVTRDLLIKLRVENALDEDYEEVFGYASLPRGIFSAVEWRF